ncbi:hypothetical protein H4S08_003898 [Coemansia sp. RSA 1365]|nr:hypothetical protein H4S08_003898 [Coemansia sp. RSA 1365]
MAQRLLTVYNRLSMLKNSGNTLDSEVKVSARIYIPWEPLEAAFKKYRAPILPHTTFAEDIADSQDLESDFETPIITDVLIPSLLSNRVDHQQRSRMIIYGLPFKLMEHDTSGIESEERRFEAEERLFELEGRRNELEEQERKLEEEERREKSYMS